MIFSCREKYPIYKLELVEIISDTNKIKYQNYITTMMNSFSLDKYKENMYYDIEKNAWKIYKTDIIKLKRINSENYLDHLLIDTNHCSLKEKHIFISLINGDKIDKK